MNYVDYIAIGVIALIVGVAIFYIIYSKKHGAKCIGCPHAKKCGSKCQCNKSNSTENK